MLKSGDVPLSVNLIAAAAFGLTPVTVSVLASLVASVDDHVAVVGEMVSRLLS